MSVENLFLYIIVPFLCLMALIIASFLYRTRARKLSPNYMSENTQTSILIDCTQGLLSEYASKIRKMKIFMPLSLVIIYLFVISMLGLGQGPEAFTILLDPQSGFHKMAIWLGVLLFISFVIVRFGLRKMFSIYETAYQLSLRQKLEFDLNTNNIRIPTLLLCEPAFAHAVLEGLHEITIPFSDIESIEVWDGAGNAPAQYKIIPRGESSKWGKSSLIQINWGICFKRAPLSAHEKEIFSFLGQVLGDRLKMHIAH